MVIAALEREDPESWAWLAVWSTDDFREGVLEGLPEKALLSPNLKEVRK